MWVSATCSHAREMTVLGSGVNDQGPRVGERDVVHLVLWEDEDGTGWFDDTTALGATIFLSHLLPGGGERQETHRQEALVVPVSPLATCQPSNPHLVHWVKGLLGTLSSAASPGRMLGWKLR